MKPTTLTVTTDAAFIAAGNPNRYFARVYTGTTLRFESVRYPTSAKALAVAEKWMRGTALPAPSAVHLAT